MEAFRDGQVDVRLRNLEYDLTSAVKKVVFGFQDLDSLLAALPEPARLTLYVTPDTLPEDLTEAEQTIQRVAEEIEASSGDKFSFTVLNPDAPGGPVSRQMLYDELGIQPFSTSLFAEESYYLHMVLQSGDQGADHLSQW